MKLRIPLVLVGVVATVLAIYLVWPEWFGFCPKVQTQTQGLICESPYEVEVGDQLLPISLGFLLAAVAAFFAPAKIYRRWLWFTLWYGIVATLLMLIVPKLGIGIGGYGFALIELHMLAQLLSWIYAISSALLIVGMSLLGREKV